MRALSLIAFLALAGSATAAVLGNGGGEQGARASVTVAGGSFDFANSRDGAPIFSATEIGPGDSASGTVEIVNEGEEPGELVLSQHDVADTAGIGGGRLSEWLSLRVTEISATAPAAVVYAGPLAPMPPRVAGVLTPGQARTFEFVAELPEAGPGVDQNAVQGASVSVAYAWTAREAPPNQSPPAGQTPARQAPGPGASPSATPPLRLAIARVGRSIRHGRILVWARCNLPCRIGARGRLRVRGGSSHTAGSRQVAKLRLARPPRLLAGTQRLSIRVPRRLRQRLGTDPKPRLTTRLVLRARDSAGGAATARRTLRVHRLRHRPAPTRGQP